MEGRNSPKDLVALAALAMLSEEPTHAYAIQRQLRSRHKDFAAGKTRALYHAIDELVAEGLVEPLETSRDGRRPERTVYRITTEGSEELVAWITDLFERPVVEHPVFNVAVGFIAYVSKERALDALRARSIALRADIAAHEESIRALTEDGRLPRVVLLELEHWIVLRRAELTWVNSLSEDIGSGRLHWDRDWLIEQLGDHKLDEVRAIEADLAVLEGGTTTTRREETTA